MSDRQFLDLASKMSQRSVVDAVERLKVEHRPPPLVVDLDPTSACDLACPECISADVLGAGTFSSPRLDQLAEELIEAGVAAVVLIGGGEPLLHRRTPDIIRRLAGAGVAVGVVTNGTRLDQCAEDVIRALNWIRVSVDAATSASYGRVRPARRGNQFDKVIDNLRYAKRAGARRLGYSFVAMLRQEPDGTTFCNFGEIPQAAALAKDIGCHYLEVKVLMESDHTVQSVLDARLEEFRAAVALAGELADSAFAVAVSDSAKALLKAGRADRQPKDYHSCQISRLRTLVTPQGVYVCSYHRGRSAFRIGDVRERSFAEMWHAADTSVVDPAADCRFHCARHDSNLRMIDRMSGEHGGEVLDDYDLFI
jgi:MoaA/NifB/PqqE/SkfB family radical SAM enzyme